MKKIFIVPYRDREPQKEIFLNQMEKLLVNEKDYEILICHQCDKRKFNRGGVKNIGFLYAKEKYSNWKDITFIFHDIDYLPYKKIFDYETTHGTVTHFYGFDFAFGGIWAIKGSDYEKIKGFPNYWAWGYEDNKIRDKWIKSGGKINNSQFIFYTDKRIVKLDCSTEHHEKRDAVGCYNLHLAIKDKIETSGYHTIRELKYTVETERENVKMINITNFLTERSEKLQKYAYNISSKEIAADLKNRKNREMQIKGPKMPMNIMKVQRRGINNNQRKYIKKKKNQYLFQLPI
jgi:hypothetical protein